MRTIISVNKCPRTHAYEISIKRPNAMAYTGERCGMTSSDAAAAATTKAIGCDDFIIIAPDPVMKLIPKEFGGRA